MVYIIIIVMMFIVGIVVLSLKPSQDNHEKRVHFLQELALSMEGLRAGIPGYKDSFSVSYNFDGHRFVYEDYIDRFADKTINRAFLKVQTNAKVTLQFNEKARGTVFDKNALQSLLKNTDTPKGPKHKLPAIFKPFDVLSNDFSFVEQMMEDRKVLSLFKGFMMTDERGWSQMPLGIRNGLIVLEFNPTFGFQPNLLDLQNNPHSLEDYTKKLLALVDYLNRAAD